jgi:hypothetical protein
MIGRSLRVLIGFCLACLAAGLTVVLFVYAPTETTDVQADRLAEIGWLSLAVATQSAVFAAPLAFIAAVFAEWQRIRGWLYYALVAVVIAAIGFIAQFRTEVSQDAAGIVGSYAAAAFLICGFVAGIVYWLVAGRSAGGQAGPVDGEIIPPAKKSDGPPARVTA